MSSIKSFDLFQKVTSKELIKSTLTGALISSIGGCLIFFLIYLEVMEYLTPLIKKETIIYQDQAMSENIKVNFSLKFLNLPCPIMSIDQEDQIGVHNLNIQDNLQKIRFTKDNKKIIGSYSPSNLDQIENSIEDHEACYISGFLLINKAAGNIHFSFHDFRDQWEYLVLQPDRYAKINLDHTFYSLSFGEKEIKTEILEKFGMNKYTEHFLHHQIASYRSVPNDKTKFNYDYYIKIIPNIFIDEISNKEYFTYQFSLSHKKNEVEEIENEMPIVKMHYDISPITIKTTLHKKHFMKFLINICAIVGGVFVVFSLIDSLIFYLFVDIVSSNEKEKNGWEK